MCKEFELIYDEKTGTWGEKKEPYITIEVESEEDYKVLLEMFEKQNAKKLIPTKENKQENGILCLNCPRCGTLLFGRDIRLRRNYCFECGQKLDWSDVTE